MDGLEEREAFRSVRVAARGYLAEMIRGGGGSEILRVRFRADQSLAHIVEALGVPRFEVGEALADGEGWDLRLPPPDGATVELLPLKEPIELPGERRFVLDVHLGRLARHLRLLGFDVEWRNDYDDLDLVRIALAQRRTVLSRDRGLLFRREFACDPGRGMLVRSRDTWTQLIEVCRRFGLASRFRPFSLCATCGAALEPARKSEVASLIPPIVAERYDEFFLCPVCGKAYWKGDHFRNLLPFIERLGRDLAD